MDPDPGSDPKLDLYLTKIIQKISNLLIMTLKIPVRTLKKYNIFFEKFAFRSIKSHLKRQCHEIFDPRFFR
jgi:hypothetical protein